LLHQGLLEDRCPDGLMMSPVMMSPADSTRPSTTLREMRRTGALGELSQEAQTRLLGGTLYEYTVREQASSDRGDALGCPGRFGEAVGTIGERPGDGEGDSQATSGPVSARIQANQAGLQDLLRLGLDRVLQLNSQMGPGVVTEPGGLAAEASPPPAPASASELASAALGLGIHTPILEWGSALHTARSSHSGLSSFRGMPPSPAAGASVAASAAGQVSSSSSLRVPVVERLSAAPPPPPVAVVLVTAAEQDSVPPVIVDAPSRTFGGALGSEELQAALPHLLADLGVDDDESDGDDGIVSVVDFEGHVTARSHVSSRGGDEHDRSVGTALDETVSVWGLNDTIHSSSSTARTSRSDSQSHSLQQSARAALGETLLSLGSGGVGVDGGLTDVLHRLALENLTLDESLTRSVRRVLQLGTVLTGQRLSDDEICALPKVRFDQAEQQNCAICLEAYQRGEFLTSLQCHHFFHVDCLGRWFRRSTQCPLCRQDYDGGI